MIMKFQLAIFASLAAFCSGKRRLELDSIAGYQPTSEVFDHAKIDLDQQSIENRTFIADFTRARNVYSEGGHSYSFAELNLTNPASNKIFLKGTRVFGISERNENVTGTVLEDVSWTTVGNEGVIVRVWYDNKDEKGVGAVCQVGGLSTFGAAERRGCFVNEGQVQFTPSNGTPESFTYKYDNRKDNNNRRTIQGFSTMAGTNMQTCSGNNSCVFYDDLQLYVDYYGDSDYADKWVLASSFAESTSFTSGRGNADFELVKGTPGRARAEAFDTGTVALNIWMAVVGELETAVRTCGTDNDGAAAALDAAVAFYTGSLEGQSGTGEGLLLHKLADTMATEMKTARWAGNDVKGTAYANLELFYHFGEMQDALLDGDCNTASTLKDAITRLLKIPLIQAALYNAWIRKNDDNPARVEEAEARGSTYAAAVLPYVYACNPTDAETIYSNVRIGSSEQDLDFSLVKAALENSYACMGIICDEVGGVWSARAGDYAEGAEPCSDGQSIEPRFTEEPSASPTNSPTSAPTDSPNAPTSLGISPRPVILFVTCAIGALLV